MTEGDGRRFPSSPGARPRRLRPLVLALILLAPAALRLPVLGQDGKTEELPPKSGKKPDKPYVIALPILYSTPETKLAFGAGGLFNFRLGAKKEETRPSSLWFFLVYTLNRQFQVSLRPEVYLPRNAFFINANIKFERFPQKFFGIGSEAPESAVESYTPETVGLQISLKKSFLGSFYAGVQYEVSSTSIRSVDPAGRLAAGDLPGSRGGLISGLGLSLNWDTRDSVLYPRRGLIFQIAGDVYSPALASDFNFTSLRLDFRTYIPFRTSDVLALQAFFKSRGGTPPFYELSMMGGDWLMRGYYKGRYRDKTILAFQAEYRMRVWKRIGVAAFGGLGEVCAGFENFRVANVLYSVGAGIRFKLDAKGGTNIRVDYAWGKHSTGLYMTAQEAF